VLFVLMVVTGGVGSVAWAAAMVRTVVVLCESPPSGRHLGVVHDRLPSLDMLSMR
jgi:hypothetical protein